MQKHVNYLPALDGMRALSILLVLAKHLGFSQVPAGFGVTVFFYISGLLITKLLLDEYKNTGGIKLKAFYMRRLLRLYPPILFLILITLAVPVLHKSINNSELAAALFYYENYYVVYHFEALKSFYEGMSSFAGLFFFWSLSVEEHFYLVFPFVFLLLVKFPKKLVLVVAAAITLCLANRIYITSVHQANDYWLTYADVITTCRADSILVGCLTSILISFDPQKVYLNFVSKTAVFLGALALLIFTFCIKSDYFKQTARFSLQGISFMVLVPAILYSGKYIKLNSFFSAKPLVFIGKLSYSLYLFNYAAYLLVDAFITPQSVSAAFIFCSLATVFLFSFLSYNLVEKPVMKLRRRFGSDVTLRLNTTPN